MAGGRMVFRGAKLLYVGVPSDVVRVPAIVTKGQLARVRVG